MKSTAAFAIVLIALCLSTVGVSETTGVMGTDSVHENQIPDMVGVLAGDFIMGREGANPDEAPRHVVYLDAFLIDATEVRLKDFVAFLNRIGDHRSGCGGQRCIVTKQENTHSVVDLREGAYTFPARFAEHPATFVTWHGAKSFCRQAGKRLPTEAQWERAARGAEGGNLYPWGDEFELSFATISENPSPFDAPTTPVGHFPEGKSSVGAYDMVGNVLEWVSDGYEPSCYRRVDARNPQCGNATSKSRVLRGGSFFNTSLASLTVKRFHDRPENAFRNYGFRCARDTDPLK